MKEQPSYYMVVPANVWSDPDLLNKPKAILLYGHIATLANQKGYCWATNKYFMNQLQIKSTTTITDYLNLLVSKGYIQKKSIYKKGTKQIEKRILSIDLTKPISVNCNTPMSVERHTPISVNCNTPMPADCKENNTSINNTSINKTTTTALMDYQKYINPILTGSSIAILTDYVNELSDEVVRFAIKQTVEHASHPSWAYLERILKKYSTLKINSLQAAKKLEQDFQNSKDKKEHHQSNNKVKLFGARKELAEKLPF